MKITGPGTPPLPPPPSDVGATEGPGQTKQTGKTDGPKADFAAKLDGPKQAGAAAGPTSVDAAQGLASELRSGRISPEQAVQKLIDQAVDSKVGASASQATRDQVRTALQNAVANDPMLAERIRKMSQG